MSFRQALNSDPPCTPVLARFRAEPWRRRARWFRGAGLALLLTAFFLRLPTPVLVAVTLPGLVLFLIGALAWLVRDTEPWRRT